VILSDALWRQRFGADPSIVGRMITLNGTPRQVVGVMPSTFAFPTTAAQLWVPMRIDRTDLGGFHLQGIARLRAGVTPEAAARELAVLLPRVSTVVDFLSPQTLRDARILPDVRPYIDEVVGRVRPVLWTLWAMVGLVLLIACVNVASLLLVRAETRRREIALRIAIGAERRHLLAQSFAESGILLVSGSALGALFAWSSVAVLPKLAPTLLPRAGDIAVDATVIVATTLIAALIAAVFGVLPFVRGRSMSASAVFGGASEDRTSTTSRTSGRLRQLLVGAQVAMATVLLVGSGLVLRSFEKLRAVDPGFRADGVITFRIALPSSRYRTSQDVARFHYEMLDRIRSLPSVAAAGATGRLPLAGVTVEADPVRLEGRVFGPNTLPPLAEMRVATPGYFEAMGIPKISGRTLERSDTEQGTGAVLVTETLVRKLMETRNPIGARVAHGLAGVRGERAWSDVVGVVGDVHGISLDKAPMGAVYYAMVNRPAVSMDWLARSMVYAVRTTAAPAVVVAAVRRELAQIDPTLPLAETRTLSSVVEAAQSGMRFSMIGFSVAAIIGLFMGAIGLYGVLSYVTAQRTREIGVRIALGATPSSVRIAVLRRGLVVSVGGLAVGMIIALLMRGLATPLLYGISPTDPVTLVAVSCTLMLVGTLATWLPARRAARLDPVMALRGE
jgi:predicted permease